MHGPQPSLVIVTSGRVERLEPDFGERAAGEERDTGTEAPKMRAEREGTFDVIRKGPGDVERHSFLGGRDERGSGGFVGVCVTQRGIESPVLHVLDMIMSLPDGVIVWIGGPMLVKVTN